jgi:UDP-2,4-diacetamido-2,4,6-trideoxy-beta-L-altropyranose hydrolase
MSDAPALTAAGLELLVRADATPQMGTGHLLRMLALGQAWQDAGGSVTALVAEAPQALLDRLAGEGFAIRPVAAAHPDADDAGLVASLAAVPGRRVAVDGLQFDLAYLECLGSAAGRTLVIDDLAALAHVARVHLDEEHLVVVPERLSARSGPSSSRSC